MMPEEQKDDECTTPGCCCLSGASDADDSDDERRDQPITAFQTTAAWSRGDRLGQIACRLSGKFRMKYAVKAGLYVIGAPDEKSDVFVSANYKLSFDLLRRALKGCNAWILVLDTKGINVWCAAGKGTFGTDELIKRLKDSRLIELVEHRRVIVPQLGAVGVNAAVVKKQTSFRVFFGPVDARDIPAYVAANYKKTPEMRRIRFSMLDRAVLVPMELFPALKIFALFALAMLAFFGLGPAGILFKDAWYGGLPFLVQGLAAVLAGSLFVPILLPFVPFRSFALKGWLAGSLISGAVFFLLQKPQGPLLVAATFIFFPLVASYVALQFTGSTTFTGISGVKKELKLFLPLYAAAAAAFCLTLVVHKAIVLF